MKKFLALFFLALPSYATSTFDDIVVENSCTVPAPINPTDATTKLYVDTAVAGATIPDASVSVKGKIQLSGDLAGTADFPTVPGLAGKEPSITGTTSTDYWRGDKTFQSLNSTAVGLGNVDNTSDSNKPISTATQTALNAKAPIASPALTGAPTAPTAPLGTSTTQLATTAFVLSQGFQGATGSMPNTGSTTLVTTTSASTAFVNALTTPITVTASSAPVIAKCVLDMTSVTAASVATVRVTINSVSGGSVTESLTTATTQHLTVANQNLSTALGPGTYTVNCDFNRASGTGTVTVGQGSLTAVALQGTESNGITQLTGALQAGPGSGSQALTGILPIANGGTHLSSTTINQILYSSAANVITGLTTANTGALVTSSTGVPSITSGTTANRLLRTNGTTVSFAQAALATDVSGTLPIANGGTGLTSIASQRIPFGTGSTALTTDSNLVYDTTNQRFSVGGFGTATGNFLVTSGSKTALQAFNSSGGNAFQSTNVSAYTAALIGRQNNATTGASIGLEFGRGTPASPTGVLNGDQIGVIIATPDASDGIAHGSSGAITFVASENSLTTATGGEIVLATTQNGGNIVPVERLRIKNSGEITLVNSHLKSTQTTPPTVIVQASAGTGATCTIANATDRAGEVTITTGTLGVSTGSYCQLNFNQAYAVAPICIPAPAGATLSTSVYVTKATGNINFNFAVAGGISSTYVINYHCEETQ